MNVLNSLKSLTPRQWACVAGAAAFLYFVWPTPYYYIRLDGDLSRVNRLTGVEEVTTDSGWRTTKQIEQEREEKKITVQSGVASEFKQVISDDVRNEFVRLAVYNPTSRKFSGNDGNVSIEYFLANNDGKPTFLCKNHVYENLEPNTHTDVELHPDRVQGPIGQLPKGTNIVQKVTLTFDKASNTGNASIATDVYLSPTLALTIERSFTTR